MISLKCSEQCLCKPLSPLETSSRTRGHLARKPVAAMPPPATSRRKVVKSPEPRRRFSRTSPEPIFTEGRERPAEIANSIDRADLCRSPERDKTRFSVFGHRRRSRDCSHPHYSHHSCTDSRAQLYPDYSHTRLCADGSVQVARKLCGPAQKSPAAQSLRKKHLAQLGR